MAVRQLLSLAFALSLLAACTAPPPAVPAPQAAASAASAPAQPVAPLTVAGTFADNAIVYALITDRFDNGNPANDNAYGRKREAAPQDDVATFHGGDLKGVTNKLRDGWFKQLGVNAICISALYEQIHGWVVGGSKEFKRYAYDGDDALDYTLLDANIGTADELREMVDTAHAQGIRIVFDVQMNHPGELDIQTAQELGVRVLWPGASGATLRNYDSFIDHSNFAFGDWWGRDWVRAALPGYLAGGSDTYTMQVASRPDFRTESKEPVKLPRFLRNKPGTRAVDLTNATVRDHLVKWLADWVRHYGIDGIHAVSVQHVEPDTWLALKTKATQALAEWKAKNPSKKIDDQPFWMGGEYPDLGPERHALNDFGFDALINFDFQRRSAGLEQPEPLFARYASALAGRPGHSTLSFLSSRDTELFDRSRLVDGAAALLLAPGGVQIFYGDETARPAGRAPASDPRQATRSDMNWSSADPALLAHWRKLGSFRSRHVALARGTHQMLSETPYVFSRIDAASDDRVVVAMNVSGEVVIPVGSTFPDGRWLKDAYGGQQVVVANGQVKLNAARYVLLERTASPTLAQ